MRPLRSVGIYIMVVFLGGGLLAPWLFILAQWAGSNSSFLDRLEHNPFHRFVNRSLILLGVLGLWPFLKSTAMNSWHGLGLARSGPVGRLAGQGFLIGFGSLAVVALIVVWSGARTFYGDRSGVDLLRHFANAGLAAVVVGCLEEIVFRGAIFGALRKAIAWPTALVLSSAFYALVHFFERPESPGSIGWSSGLLVLSQMMRGFGDWQTLIPGFFNLTLAGVILGLGYQFTASLHFSIGLHAGWIFWLKSYGFVTRPATGSNPWFWGSGELIDGWLAFATLSAVVVLVCRRYRNHGVEPGRSSTLPAH